jgi:hypothetical protein
MDFGVPIGQNGDNYDRYLMRMEELRQSEKIVRQSLREIPPGPIIVDDWRIVPPPKAEVYGTIEGVMAHFKLVMEGVPVPPGEVYDCTEAANGELGWYLVSDGSGRPYKVHVRAPGFALLSGNAPHGRGEDAGRRDSDVRHHQHDRRRGGAVSESDGKKPSGERSASPGADGPSAADGFDATNPRLATASGPGGHRAPAARGQAAPTPPTPGGKPAPKHPGFVTVTVDGKELVAKPART